MLPLDPRSLAISVSAEATYFTRRAAVSQAASDAAADFPARMAHAAMAIRYRAMGLEPFAAAPTNQGGTV